MLSTTTDLPPGKELVDGGAEEKVVDEGPDGEGPGRGGEVRRLAGGVGPAGL